MFRTFEFIDVADWCRPAQDEDDLIATPRTWRQVTPSEEWSPCPVPQTEPPGLGEHLISQRFCRPYKLPGSIIAHLDNVILKNNSLLVLVKENLALTEGYGCREVMELALRRYPTYHNVYMAEFDFKNQRRREPIKGYEIGEERPVVVIDTPCVYLSFRDDDRNIGHWLIEGIIRMMCLDQIPALRNLPLLVRAPLTQYQSDVMALFKIDNPYVIMANESDVIVKDLYFPSFPHDAYARKDALDWLRNRLLANLPAGEARPKRRILISRADANTRRVTTEDAIIEAMRPLGFEVLTLSPLTIDERLRLFADAEIIISPHGGGSTWAFCCPPGCGFVELQSVTYASDFYVGICHLMDLRYYAVLGEEVNNLGDYSIEVDHVRKAVAELLSGRETPPG